MDKQYLIDLLELEPSEEELLNTLASKAGPMNAEKMIELLFTFDEIENELGSAPDSDFIESLGYKTGTKEKEIARFWHYLECGQFDEI